MIAGIQKMTLLDYPGKVACTVFLAGCNLRCPFCHNSQLLDGTAEILMDTQALLAFLESRKGLLDGVCVTGGEPTLQPALPALLEQIKAMGFSVKLDTNGTRPQVLRELVSRGVVDYVAMDVKNAPSRYGLTTGVSAPMDAIGESLRFLLSDAVPYELRTTLVEPLHTQQSILEMGQWLASLVPGRKPRQLYLQSFVDRDTVRFSGLSAPDPIVTENYAQMLAPFIQTVQIRNK